MAAVQAGGGGDASPRQPAAQRARQPRRLRRRTRRARWCRARGGARAAARAPAGARARQDGGGAAARAEQARTTEATLLARLELEHAAGRGGQARGPWTSSRARRRASRRRCSRSARSRRPSRSRRSRQPPSRSDRGSRRSSPSSRPSCAQGRRGDAGRRASVAAERARGAVAATAERAADRAAAAVLGTATATAEAPQPPMPTTAPPTAVRLATPPQRRLSASTRRSRPPLHSSRRARAPPHHRRPGPRTRRRRAARRRRRRRSRSRRAPQPFTGDGRPSWLGEASAEEAAERRRVLFRRALRSWVAGWAWHIRGATPTARTAYATRRTRSALAQWVGAWRHRKRQQPRRCAGCATRAARGFDSWRLTAAHLRARRPRRGGLPLLYELPRACLWAVALRLTEASQRAAAALGSSATSGSRRLAAWLPRRRPTRRKPRRPRRWPRRRARSCTLRWRGGAPRRGSWRADAADAACAAARRAARLAGAGGGRRSGGRHPRADARGGVAAAEARPHAGLEQQYEMWEEARFRLQRMRQCVGAMRARG